MRQREHRGNKESAPQPSATDETAGVHSSCFLVFTVFSVSSVVIFFRRLGMLRLSRPLWILFALHFLVARSIAAESWPVPHALSHELNPYRFVPALIKRVPREF